MPILIERDDRPSSAVTVFGRSLFAVWVGGVLAVAFESAIRSVALAEPLALAALPLAAATVATPALVTIAALSAAILLSRGWLEGIVDKALQPRERRPSLAQWLIALALISIPLALAPLAEPLFAARYTFAHLPAALCAAAFTSLAVVVLWRMGRLDSVIGLLAIGCSWSVVLARHGEMVTGRWTILLMLPWIAFSVALWARGRPRGRTMVVALLSLPVLLLLGWLSQTPGTKRLALRFHPQAASFARWTRAILDFDRDGASMVLGGGDCDDLDASIHPVAIEIVGNGIDDNCMGGDLASLPDIDAPVFPPTIRPGSGTTPVVAISIDALRADHVGLRRSRRSITPNLDQLARQSVYFRRAYAHAPYTHHSLASIWSSSPLLSSTVMTVFLGHEATLSEVLSKAGYRTVAIPAFFEIPWDFVLGFEEVDTRCVDQTARYAQRPARRTTARALQWIERLASGGPFFLWIHYVDPHSPYFTHPEASWLGNDRRGRYAQEIFHCDRQLGLIIAALKSSGLWDKAIIVFFSDHGELLGEHGLYEHAFTLHQQVLRVPLLFHLPGVKAASVDTPVSLMDLVPMVLDLLHIPRPRLWRGRSLVPALRGGKLSTQPLFFTANYEAARFPTLGVLIHPWKYVVDLGSGWSTLSRVDGAAADLPIDDSARALRLKRLMGKWVDRTLNDQWVARKNRLMKERRPRMPRKGFGAMKPLPKVIQRD